MDILKLHMMEFVDVFGNLALRRFALVDVCKKYGLRNDKMQRVSVGAAVQFS